MSNTLKVGAMAPDFSAMAFVAGEFKKVGLKDFQGKWTCLFFYPLDFTLVCPTELRAFAQFEAQFNKLGCEIIGCSTDSEYSHKAWFEKELPEVKFPILADTSHKISSAYEVLMEEGYALRGTYLIDPQGTLQWMMVNGVEVGRSVDEVLRTLQALRTGKMCPADWKPGQATIQG